MKVSLALCLFVCIVGVYCDDTKKLETDDHVIKDCAAEQKIDTKILDEAFKNKKFPEKTPEMQGFMGCMMKKEGMMNDDGIFTNEFTDQKATEPCRNLGGKDTNEIAYNAVECLFKNHLVETKTSK